jgi:hypothetical protein
MGEGGRRRDFSPPLLEASEIYKYPSRVYNTSFFALQQKRDRERERVIVWDSDRERDWQEDLNSALASYFSSSHCSWNLTLKIYRMICCII